LSWKSPDDVSRILIKLLFHPLHPDVSADQHRFNQHRAAFICPALSQVAVPINIAVIRARKQIKRVNDAAQRSSRETSKKAQRCPRARARALHRRNRRARFMD
jgi:hypothetical protein